MTLLDNAVRHAGSTVDISQRMAPGAIPASTPKLALKWAFGFPNGNSAYAQPTVAGGRVFVGAQNGTVYSLDAKTGCTYWTYVAGAGVRGADRHRHGSR